MTGFEITPWGAVGVALFGLLMGFLSGLFGVGGGFLMTPGLNILFQMPAPLAIGTSLCQMIGTATAGVRRHLKLGNVDVKLSLMVMGGALGGVPLGSWTVDSLKGFGQYVLFGRMLPVVELVIRVAYLVLLLVIAVLIYREAHQALLGLRVTTGPWRGARLRIGPMVRFYGTGDQPISLFVVTYLSLGIGFLSAILGLGGGVLLIPGLIYLLGVSTRVAVGTSLLQIIFIAACGTAFRAWAGDVHLGVALASLAGSTVGSQLGVALHVKMDPNRIRMYFGLMLAAATLLILYGIISLWLGSTV